jgi:acyl-CoA thioesterase
MSGEADRLARRCADAMYGEDHAARHLGIEILEVGPGRSVLAFTVRSDMINGHDICHGGMIFTLADTAFAYACNSYNDRAVAFTADITFIVPAKKGDRLTATAQERQRAGRSGIYDVRVADQTGKVVAEFRGRSRTIGGSLVEA